MPANIVPVAEFLDKTYQRAAAFELGGMETGTAPLAPLLEALFSRALFARGALWGQLVWNGRLEVGGTAAAPVVKVGTIEAVTLRAAVTRDGVSLNAWQPFFGAVENTLGIAHVEGAPGSLSASTFYYVYIYSNGTTTPQFQITTTPPTESATPTVLQQWKRGQNANYRYLGCFPTDASGNPVPLLKYEGLYTYDFSAVSGATLRVLNSGALTTWTDVSLAAWVPPHVRVVGVKADYTAGVTPVALLRTKGREASNYDIRCPASGLIRAHLRMLTDANQAIQYQVSTGDLSAYVTDFSE